MSLMSQRRSSIRSGYWVVITAVLTPDYSQTQAWAVWPGRPSAAEVIPSGVVDQAPNQSASVDVFFVHPTTYMTGSQANARFDEPGMPSILISTELDSQCRRVCGIESRRIAIAVNSR
jgi:hypothetical protein